MCPFIVDVKLTGRPLQAVVSTLGQDLTAGSPIGVKMAFHNSFPTTAQHAVGGAGISSHDAPGNRAILSANTRLSEQSQFSILRGFPLSAATCRLRCYRWICGGTVNGAAVGQSIHLMLRHMAGFQSCQGVDVLRSGPCGDWWPFGCIWVLILVGA